MGILKVLKQEHGENMKLRVLLDRSTYKTLSDEIKPTIIKESVLKGHKGL
jgi:hypothetical protein